MCRWTAHGWRRDSRTCAPWTSATASTWWSTPRCSSFGLFLGGASHQFCVISLHKCLGTCCPRNCCTANQRCSFQRHKSSDLQNVTCAVACLQQNELRLQSSLTDAALRYLEPLRSLRTLSLRGCNTIEGASLRMVCPTLIFARMLSSQSEHAARRNLSSGVLVCAGPGLRHIVALTNLRSLDLTGCVRLTNKGGKPASLQILLLTNKQPRDRHAEPTLSAALSA